MAAVGESTARRGRPRPCCFRVCQRLSPWLPAPASSGLCPDPFSFLSPNLEMTIPRVTSREENEGPGLSGRPRKRAGTQKGREFHLPTFLHPVDRVSETRFPRGPQPGHRCQPGEAHGAQQSRGRQQSCSVAARWARKKRPGLRDQGWALRGCAVAEGQVTRVTDSRASGGRVQDHLRPNPLWAPEKCGFLSSTQTLDQNPGSGSEACIFCEHPGGFLCKLKFGNSWGRSPRAWRAGRTHEHAGWSKTPRLVGGERSQGLLNGPRDPRCPRATRCSRCFRNSDSFHSRYDLSNELLFKKIF